MVFTGSKHTFTTPLDKTIQILKAKLDTLVKEKNINLPDEEVVKLGQHIDRLVVIAMNTKREEPCPECGATMIHEACSGGNSRGKFFYPLY